MSFLHFSLLFMVVQWGIAFRIYSNYPISRNNHQKLVKALCWSIGYPLWMLVLIVARNYYGRTPEVELLADFALFITWLSHAFIFIITCFIFNECRALELKSDKRYKSSMDA